MNTASDRLVQALERYGIAYSSELQRELCLSQATVSRLLKAAGGRIYRLGKGRNSRYSLLHPLFTPQPLYRINPAGIPEQLAEIAPLVQWRYAIDAAHHQRWLTGLDDSGLFDDLPNFLDDLRPQGFLGRQIARQLGASFPADPRHWRATQVWAYLLEFGADMPGDLVLGERALAAANHPPEETPVDNYPALAERVLSGLLTTSSAGGEQPKFTTYTANGHVMVKFSPRGHNPEASRWRDILIAEQLAGDVLREAGLATATSRLHEREGRLFLEVQRFERQDATGRRPMISLTAIDAEFSGIGHDWPSTLRRLLGMKLVNDADLQTALFAHLFGQWIGNTDMHLGNLSFHPTETTFRLLPLYDMAPMRWAPVRGELPQSVNLPLPVRDPRDEVSWFKSGTLAMEFWGRLSEARRLSSAFRQIAEQARCMVSNSL